MTISSSLNASVAGLAANASRLASISDNISNASTYGYKRAETDFNSMVVSSAEGTYSAGGVRTTTTRAIDEMGSLVSTSSALDLAVSGRGMLPVTTSASVADGGNDSPFLMTTTGSFSTDEDGYLTTSSGLVLMGWPANADGSISTHARDTAEGLEPILINASGFAGEPTTAIEMQANLPATSTAYGAEGAAEELTVEYYDNLGKTENLGIEFVPIVPEEGSSNTWTMVITDSASGDAVVGEYTLTFDDTRDLGGTLESVKAVMGGAYNAMDGTITITVDGGPISIDIGTLGDTDGLTQLSDTFQPGTVTKDGSEVGNLTTVGVDENGNVTASFDTGVTRVLYQVPLVDVANVNGLEAVGGQAYRITNSSGSMYLWDAGDGPTGEIASYAREESTTDVASELTDLIQTQRAYSSNAKVIQTVDEMLQETTNIKR